MARRLAPDLDGGHRGGVGCSWLDTAARNGSRMLAPAFRRVWTWLGSGGRAHPSLPPTMVVGRLVSEGRRLSPAEAVALAAALGELATWRGGGANALPSLDAIGVDWSGRVVVLDECQVAGDPIVQRLAALVLATTRGAHGERRLQPLTAPASRVDGSVPSLADWLERLDPHAPRNRRVVLAGMVQRMHRDESESPASASRGVHPTSHDDAERLGQAAVGVLANAAAHRSTEPLLWRTVGGFLAALGLVLLGSFLTLWTARSILREQAARDSLGSTVAPAESPADFLAPATVAAAAEPVREGLVASSAAGVPSAEPLRDAFASPSAPSEPPASAPMTFAGDSKDGEVTGATATAAGDQTYRPPLSRRSTDGGRSTRALASEAPLTASSGPSVESQVAKGATAAVLWSRPRPQPFPVPESGAAASSSASPVYSRAAADVEPPRLKQVADLLQGGATDAADIRGSVELVIDEGGRVEHVKLVARGDYAEIQRVARAWRQAEFTPASREGRAVRFRTTLPLRLNEP